MATHPIEPPHHHMRWIDISLSALLAVQALTLFVAIPLGTAHPAAHILLDICHLAFALVCIAVLTRHIAVRVALFAALVIIASRPVLGRHILVDFGINGVDPHELIALTAFGFNAAVTALVARHVFGPGRVTAHRVQGAILLYLNVAALFAIAFGVMVSHVPGAVTLTTGGTLPSGTAGQTAALTYFSLATITTTGFGDLVPVSPLARSLANLESVIGQLFPATLLARIVALHLAHADDGIDAAEIHRPLQELGSPSERL